MRNFSSFFFTLPSGVAGNMKYIDCNDISVAAGAEAVVPGYSGAVLLFDHTSLGGICGLVLYSYGSIEVVGLKIEANISGTSSILVYYDPSRGLVIKNNTTTDLTRLKYFKFTT